LLRCFLIQSSAVIDRFCEIGQRVRLLCRWRLYDQRTSVYILWDAYECRLPGAQRIRIPRQRARCRENTSGRFPLRSDVLTKTSLASDTLIARPRRVLFNPWFVSHRRQAPCLCSHIQHGPKYVYLRRFAENMLCYRMKRDVWPIRRIIIFKKYLV